MQDKTKQHKCREQTYLTFWHCLMVLFAKFIIQNCEIKSYTHTYKTSHIKNKPQGFRKLYDFMLVHIYNNPGFMWPMSHSIDVLVETNLRKISAVRTHNSFSQICGIHVENIWQSFLIPQVWNDNDKLWIIVRNWRIFVICLMYISVTELEPRCQLGKDF